MCSIIYYDFNVNVYKNLLTMIPILYFFLIVTSVFLLQRGHKQCYASFHTTVGFKDGLLTQKRDNERRKKQRKQSYLMIGGGAVLLLLVLLGLSQVVDASYQKTAYACIGGMVWGAMVFYPFKRLVSYYSKGFQLTDMRPFETCGFIIMILSGLAFFVILINQFVFRL